MKISALAFANASALTGAILWTICSSIAVLLPGLYEAGVELLALGSSVGHFNVSLTSVISGGLLFTVIAWLSGYLFGWSLGKFAKT
ncbi:hypothetical protein A2872_03210 [Candidatus Gottesmanbacteria bacterium RIFCSPHIGHO2_01_FULL_42_12]|uniref:Uncharacterized protein n=1 Tax=Candidatus Gottesmanbacteria bacterium RIFCSPHIGHO2_01_FULL_42_12 TaxID=1798377 RepID=A0A1F5Z021_9BACT|nr:MAG: hypothetical protein A2872_03210 [Candidatus Gottesmanbacteria bacterium RIFCSPHIGHO2_01_FULL_42_12]